MDFSSDTGRIRADGQTPSRWLRFFYNTRIGGVMLRLMVSPFITKTVGKFLDTRLSKPLIKGFVKRNGIDLSECREQTFPCFNACFTRALKEGARPFPPDPATLPSPCDAKLSAYRADDGCTFTVKGFSYTVESLLRDCALAEHYKGGTVLVFRLSVDDYHRYFYIDNGTKGENVYIKGKFHTVQPIALEKRRVFSENAREYTVMETEHFGKVTQVEVGAMMVGRIVNRDGAGAFTVGTEKGRFEYGGSTVILLFEKGRIDLDGALFRATEEGYETRVKVGEAIGRASAEAFIQS